jgi:hypothetical protein
MGRLTNSPYAGNSGAVRMLRRTKSSKMGRLMKTSSLYARSAGAVRIS